MSHQQPDEFFNQLSNDDIDYLNGSTFSDQNQSSPCFSIPSVSTFDQLQSRSVQTEGEIKNFTKYVHHLMYTNECTYFSTRYAFISHISWLLLYLCVYTLLILYVGINHMNYFEWKKMLYVITMSKRLLI